MLVFTKFTASTSSVFGETVLCFFGFASCITPDAHSALPPSNDAMVKNIAKRINFEFFIKLFFFLTIFTYYHCRLEAVSGRAAPGLQTYMYLSEKPKVTTREDTFFLFISVSGFVKKFYKKRGR